jgi:hypothetical protein
MPHVLKTCSTDFHKVAVAGATMTKAMKSKVGTRAGSDQDGEIVSAVVLAGHLDVGRTFIPKLEADGVIHRLPGGGYRLGEARTSYIRHLRRGRLQSPKSKAEQAFLNERTKALEIKNAQRLGALFPREVAERVIDDYIAAATIELQHMPARVAGSDPVLRRCIERAVFEARDAISGRIAEKARQAMSLVSANDAR